jgi:mannose-6-phosphate isomerase-like protein (cupin superfamily)
MKSREFLFEEAKNKDIPSPKNAGKKDGFGINIEEETINNTDYRRVLFTTTFNQLVVMSIIPGQEIGAEVHDGAQFIRCDAGSGVSILNGKEHSFKNGDCVVVPAGTEHNIINTSESEDLKIYTVYSPPQHKDGLVEKTKPVGKDEDDVPERKAKGHG